MCMHGAQDVSCFQKILHTRPDISAVSYGLARRKSVLGWNRGSECDFNAVIYAHLLLQAQTGRVFMRTFFAELFYAVLPEVSYREIQRFCSRECVTMNLMFSWCWCLLPVESLRWWRTHMPLKHVHASRPLWGCGGIEHWGFRNPTGESETDLSVHLFNIDKDNSSALSILCGKQTSSL